MTAFHNALQQTVKGTSLTIKVAKEIYESGTVVFTANFKGINDSVYSSNLLEVQFRMYEGKVRVLANLADVRFDTTSESVQEKLEQHDTINSIAKTLMLSEEIKEHFLAVVQDEANKVSETHSKALSKLEKTHELLTEETASQLTEEMIERVRKFHAETNKHNTTNYKTECESTVRPLTLHDNGKTDEAQVRITLKNRIGYKINYSSHAKQEIIEWLVGKWVVKGNKRISVY